MQLIAARVIFVCRAESCLWLFVGGYCLCHASAPFILLCEGFRPGAGAVLALLRLWS